MLHETVKNKTADKLPGKPSKISKMDLKNGDIGLTKPGSNWKKFKSIVAQVASEKAEESIVHVERTKRRRYKPFNPDCKTEPPISDSSKKQQTAITTTENEKKAPFTGLTKAVAMDCEMVGIGKGGVDSMIARVSIVNKNGHCVYDKYVKPIEDVTDFRTAVSGIRPFHLAKGEDFKVVQKEVADILKGRTLVGHALHNDLAVLFLSHPKKHQRDTSRYKLFKKVTKGNTPSLKKLASELLGVDIQSGEHSSIEDARAAMQLYQLYKKKWENDLRIK